MALLQPTHEPVLCREKFIIKKIERVDTNKYCGYFFPCVLIYSKDLAIATLAIDPNVGSFEMAGHIFNEKSSTIIYHLRYNFTVFYSLLPLSSHKHFLRKVSIYSRVEKLSLLGK